MVDRVKPLKLESPDSGGVEEDFYPTSLDPSEDFIECAGLVLDDATHTDETALIWRSDTDMLFKDGNNPSGYTLSQLAGSSSTGVSYNEFLLDSEPTAETGTTDCTYTPTYSTGKITKEEWKRNDTTLVKSIDYSYTSGQVTQEVRKVFALDGSTVVAQVTWSYSYTGGKLTSATMVRDV